MLKTKYTVPFTTNYSDVPLIKLRQGSSEFYAIIDTGSELTFIDSNFTGDITTSKEDSKDDTIYVSFSGSSTGQCPKAHLNCSVICEHGEYSATISARLSDLSSIQKCFDKWTGGEVKVPMIIGSDVLIKNEAIIDYENKSFSFYDKIDEEKPV